MFKTITQLASLGLIGAMGIATPSHAATIIVDGTAPGYVNDGSFESGGVWRGGETSSALAAELGIQKDITYRDTAASGVIEGLQYLVVGFTTTDDFGGYLDTGYTLSEGDTFDFSFKHSEHSGPDAAARQVDWLLFTTTDGTDAGAVDAVIASGTTAIANGSTIGTESLSGIGTVSAASDGDRLFLAFTPSGGNGTTNQIDEVNLTAIPVPEPGSLALLSLGGLLIARRRHA